jgi:phospholipid N-methyltransferase
MPQWKSLSRDFLPPIVVRAIRPTPRRFISATETIRAAQADGLSVCDYVERLWGIEGQTASIIERLCHLGAISAAANIVEIGPGTGRYMEHVLRRCLPRDYQVYEIDPGWSSWLAKTYPIEACDADGQSLRSTQSGSRDFIHAHGVFVYLPFMVSYRYFQEIARVAAPGAFVAFDIISEKCLDPSTVITGSRTISTFPAFSPPPM